MFSLELCRAISADREREVERAVRQRRLLEVLAIRKTDATDDGSRPGGRAPLSGAENAPALHPAR